MEDKIETIEGSVVQHGHHNGRIYLMHLNSQDTGSLILKLDRMAIAAAHTGRQRPACERLRARADCALSP